MAAPNPEEAQATDGRRARGERTRLRVLEALLALVETGELRPTAQEVASRAGVALRTVYHHFEDVEALRRVALDLQFSRHVEILQSLDPASDLEDRVHAVARQLRKLFEAVTPIRRATMFDEHNSSAMAEGLRSSHLVRRNHVTKSFAPEIARRKDEGRTLVDALDAATSWANWHYVRTILERTPLAAEKVLVLSMRDLLAPRPTKAPR